jgi:hypothetical protein
VYCSVIMYVCVFECGYVCMCVCVYIYLWESATVYFLCEYAYVNVCMHVTMYVCMCVCQYVCVYVCMYACKYVCKYVFVYIYLLESATVYQFHILWQICPFKISKIRVSLIPRLLVLYENLYQTRLEF